jgi:hypothetical protein
MTKIAARIFNSRNEIINENITDKEKHNLSRAYTRMERKNKQKENYFPADFDQFACKVYKEGNTGGGGSENSSGGGCLALDLRSVKNIATGFIKNELNNHTILWVKFCFVKSFLNLFIYYRLVVATVKKLYVWTRFLIIIK